MNDGLGPLPIERLSTTDEHGHRVYVYPENVQGKWKDRRMATYWFLIIIYLVIPWIHYNGKPLIFLNITELEFVIFGQTFLPHDGPLIFLPLVGLLFFFGFVTSIWGRVWCGWGCPQTVFIDAIYRKIEQIVEGRARSRRKLQRSPWTFEKVWKKALKWTLFTIVSLHISHSLLGYFVGARRLFEISLHSPSENMGLFILMLSLTSLFLFDFGWFREQFCLVACPYGRFQSIMMDENSLVVAYDYRRGEPRRGQTQENEKEGDCIDCNFCVKVCPTGIDIRKGTQLECISCTMCIDACDEIMNKIKKEPGLISYKTESELKNKKRKKISLRSIIYLSALCAALIGFFFAVKSSNHLKIVLLRGSNTPFKISKSSDGNETIINHYKARFDYKGGEKYKIWFRLQDPINRKFIDVVSPLRPLHVRKGNQHTNIFFKFRRNALDHGNKDIILEIRHGEKLEHSKLIQTKRLNLVGPL